MKNFFLKLYNQSYLEYNWRLDNKWVISNPDQLFLGEAGVPFIFAAGSEFDEIFVGVGAKRVRELFGEYFSLSYSVFSLSLTVFSLSFTLFFSLSDTAKHLAPCIVFIDEIDSLAAKRNSGPYSPPYLNQSINQLLTELDG